jgi:hypothetical protein
MNDWISSTFSKPLSYIFSPIDGFLTPIDVSVSKFFAVGLFLATICWVMFILKKEYVNLDQPKKGIFYDLRLWTLVSMVPHMLIYWVWAS